jgi:uncharacterized protein
MSFPIPVCTACGRGGVPPPAVFPSLGNLCPSCGRRSWANAAAEAGRVEEVTERAGVHIASVRTDLGPVVVARVAEATAPGDMVRLDADGGVPVGRRE